MTDTDQAETADGAPWTEAPKSHTYTPRHPWTADKMVEWDPADPLTRERTRGPTLKSDGTLVERCEP